MSELYDILVETPPTKVILLALDQGLWDCERSLAELAALCEANHMEAVAEVTQKRQTPETGIVLGSGKLEEAAAAAAVQAKPGEAGAGIAAATAANAALSAEAAKALSGDAAKAKAKAEELAAATKPATVHEKVMAARMEATEKAQAEVNAERAAEAELASEILGTAKPAKKKKRPAAADAANESAATQKEE